ncbi:MAG: hypothetical protein RL274_2876 [Pseudomonadota bacterium]
MSVCFSHLGREYSGTSKVVNGVKGHTWTVRRCGAVENRVWLPNHTSKCAVVEYLTAQGAIAREKAIREGASSWYVQMP